LSNTTGQYNTAVGHSALDATTTGALNSAVGYGALGANTTGSNNVAVGADSMAFNTTGINNVAVGYYTLVNAVGTVDNTAVGAYASNSITTGLRNTSVGYGSGDNITTGSLNISLGYLARPSSATVSGECTLGDTNITNLRCNDTSISSLSDGRDKTDVVDNPYGLEFVNTLKPRQFKWETREGNVKDGETRLGFIAQELLEAADGNNNVLDLVYESNPDRLEAKYGNLIPVLTKAIQELSAENKALAARLVALESN
jgi:hypothetical protein